MLKVFTVTQSKHAKHFQSKFTSGDDCIHEVLYFRQCDEFSADSVYVCGVCGGVSGQKIWVRWLGTLWVFFSFPEKTSERDMAVLCQSLPHPPFSVEAFHFCFLVVRTQCTRSPSTQDTCLRQTAAHPGAPCVPLWACSFSDSLHSAFRLQTRWVSGPLYELC